MIAKATCPKCGGHDFEAQTHKSRASDEEFKLVQCTDCGTVVGVDSRDFDWYALIKRVENIEQMLKDIQ